MGHLRRLLAVMFLLSTAGCDDQNITLGATETKSSSATRSPANTSPTIQRAKDICPRLLDSPPRGLACLHCSHPKAEAQFKQLVSAIQRSCVRNVAINFLVDGTFGTAFGNIERQIPQLTKGGRNLFITLYLSNGPSQRLWRMTPIEAVGTRIKPAEFRQRIMRDYDLQYEFQSSVSRIAPLVTSALDHGALVQIVPMLEDNLDDQAFEELARLAREALPESDRLTFGRNPCPRCAEGNENGLPPGFFLEIHTASPNFALRDGIVTNDGAGYDNGKTTLAELAAVRDSAASKNDTFILWSAKRQGLDDSEDRNPQLTHPDQRVYPELNERDIDELAEFLREGLK